MKSDKYPTKELLEALSSPLAKRLQSYSFKLSQTLFGLRILMNISRRDAAKIVGVSEAEYTKLEQGIADVSRTEYEEAIDRLTRHSNKNSL